MIKNICEILVDFHFFDTRKKAQAAVKRGEVYVNNIRVANTDALLVIVEYVYVKHAANGRFRKGNWIAHDAYGNNHSHE